MTPEEQRIAIAKACEGQCCRMNEEGEWMLKGAWETRFEPLTDLNAMHEVASRLDGNQQFQWQRHMRSILGLAGGGIGLTEFDFAHATAAQRSEAFLKTIGKWKE